MAAAFPYCEEWESVAERRNDQGLHQCEVFGHGPEKEESWLAWQTCDKNLTRGHVDFIPVLEFSQDHLPVRYRVDTLLALISVIAELTVRLRVGGVSASRPDGYTFARCKGRKLPYTGTGWVYEVSRGRGPCPCHPQCGSAASSGQWWRVVVFTACHVVYDRTEAADTKVDLFYDHENSQVKTLQGLDVEDNNQKDDVCLLQCVTHDAHLVKTLMASIERYERLKWDVPESVMSTLCVVVSHPHGQPKKVTVGTISGMATFDPEASFLSEYMYLYTAATCNGSSGAPVISAVSKKRLGSKGVWPGAGPHSWGHVDGECTLNQCGPGIFYVGAELLDKTMRQDSMKKLVRSSRHGTSMR